MVFLLCGDGEFHWDLLFCKLLDQAFIPGINPAGHDVPSCLDISGFSLLLFEKGFGSA